VNPRGLWQGGDPAVFVGVALGVNGPLAAALLLYAGVGLPRALGFFLAVLLLSVAVGLLDVPPPQVAGNPDRVRARWTWMLLTFALAAVFAAGWEWFRGYGVTGWSQGVGLAVLVALPFHAGGRVLAVVGLRSAGVGPPVLFGATLGVLTLAFLAFPRITPATLLLLSISVLSVGALRHGRLLAQEPPHSSLEVPQPELSAPEPSQPDEPVRTPNSTDA